MSESRTPEQVEADQLLESAITNYLIAHEMMPSDGVAIERWIVVGKAMYLSDQEDGEAGSGVYFRLMTEGIDYDVAIAMLMRAQRTLLNKFPDLMD